jgi:hypothetical protein
MYSGSGGVLYGLFKYNTLLDQETGGKQPCWLSEKLKKALKNIDKVPCVEYEASFMQGKVGVDTLQCLA